MASRNSAPADPNAVTMYADASTDASQPASPDPFAVTDFAARDLGAGELARGDVVGRYVVLSRIGQGGMGVVYAAYDPKLDRRIALKLLLSHGEDNTAARTRLLREAQSLAQLAHPNVVAVFDVGTLDERVWIAMEYVEGVTLTDWLRQGRRRWQDVLRVFLSAAEGLQAAHAVGLIHRDFKPDNVLVGADGRIRVLDFGLARLHDAHMNMLQTAGSDDPFTKERTSEQVRAALLTRVGTLLGTPAYMSPEQHEARPADERSDQFSFCVSLYEGLWGERPFSGNSRDELHRAVVLGPRPPPSDGTPRWLRAAVTRGLALRPEDRHPSMTALLATLRRDTTARQLWYIAGLGGGVVLGLAGALVLYGPEAACRDAVTLSGVWDDDRRAQVGAAFSETGVVYADTTRARILGALDEYARVWTAQATARCESSRNDPDDARRGLCLERRRIELRALVDVLVDANAATVEHAASALGQLRDPARCSDADALTAESAEVPPPADPDIAVATWALRERLAGVRILELAGSYDEALVRLDPLIVDAKTLEYPPVIAEARLLRAVLLARESKHAEAEVELMAAIAEAERSNHDRLRAEALVHRIEIVGHLAARPEAVAPWVTPTETLVHRLAPDSELEGRLFTNIGLMRARQSRLHEAHRYQQLAVQLLGGLHRDGDPVMLRALVNLGRSQADLERPRDAAVTLERARRAAEQELGPEHPILVDIHLHLAGVSPADQQEGLFRRALDLATTTLGPDDPSVALALAGLGKAQFRAGRREEAMRAYQRALAIHRHALGDHSNTAMILQEVGLTLFELGRYGAAIDALGEVARIYEHVDADPYVRYQALVIIGDSARRIHEWDRSRGALRRAAAVIRDNAELAAFDAMVAVQLARTHLDAGDAPDPRVALELLAPLRARDSEPDPERDFAYARALWETDASRRSEAVAEAVAAERVLAAQIERPGPAPAVPAVADLANVRAWIAARR